MIDISGIYAEMKAELLKELHHLKLNLSWLTNRTLTTEVLTLSLTKKCNLNCTYCWDHDQRDRLDELSTEDIKRLLKSARKLGVRSFNPFGGEPFLRRDATEIIRFAYDIGFKQVTVTTNGTLLSDEKIFEVVQSVPPEATMGVLISLDGADETENDFIRNGGSFAKTTRAVRTFRSARDNLKRDVGIVINTVVSRNNFRSMPRQVELSRSLGADSVHFITPIVNGGVVANDMAARDLFIPPEDFADLDRAIDEILELKRSTTVILNNEQSLERFKDFYRRQYAQHQHLVVASPN